MNGALSVEVRILDGRIHQWALPRYHSAMAAGVDLFACVDEPLEVHAQTAAVLVPSGIAVHIGDPMIAGLIVPRSGLGHRHGVVLGNLVGVLDADYTGPLMISVWNRNPAGSPPALINPGDRIAQLLFVPILRPTLHVVAEFSKGTTRGSGGFGSTGHALTIGKSPVDDG
jgi:dUTP pyrophosphatase